MIHDAAYSYKCEDVKAFLENHPPQPVLFFIAKA